MKKSSIITDKSFPLIQVSGTKKYPTIEVDFIMIDYQLSYLAKQELYKLFLSYIKNHYDKQKIKRQVFIADKLFSCVTVCSEDLEEMLTKVKGICLDKTNWIHKGVHWI